VRWLDLEAGLHKVDGEPFGEWGGWQEVDKEMSVTSSAVSTTDLVSAVESSPSASPLANDLRAGGPGGEGGAGGIPGTSLPLGRARFGVAARDELSPTPGRELGLGDLDLGDLGLGDESACFLRGDGVSPSLVQSLSLVFTGEGARVDRNEWQPSCGVLTATMSVCARESQDLEEEGGTGSRREGGRDMVMEEGRPGRPVGGT